MRGPVAQIVFPENGGTGNPRDPATFLILICLALDNVLILDFASVPPYFWVCPVVPSKFSVNPRDPRLLSSVLVLTERRPCRLRQAGVSRRDSAHSPGRSE